MHFLMTNSYPSQTTHTKLPSLRTTTRLGGLQGSLQGEPTGGAYRGSLQWAYRGHRGASDQKFALDTQTYRHTHFVSLNVWTRFFSTFKFIPFHFFTSCICTLHSFIRSVCEGLKQNISKE